MEGIGKPRRTNIPLTYTVDNSIYNIKPQVEEAAPVPEPDRPVTGPTLGGGGTRIQKIHSASLIFNAIDLVQALGGKVLTVGDMGQFGQGGMGGGYGGLGGGLGGGGLGGGGFGGGRGGFGGGGGRGY